MDLFFIWLITFVGGLWIFKKMKEWQILPPGPWNLPIVGYLPFIERDHPHLSLTKLSKTYGPIYGIKMGSVYCVVLSDHKLVREAFSKESFSGRAPLYLTHGIMHGNGEYIFFFSLICYLFYSLYIRVYEYFDIVNQGQLSCKLKPS